MFTESGSVDQSSFLLLPLDARQLARDKGCGLVREGEGEGEGERTRRAAGELGILSRQTQRGRTNARRAFGQLPGEISQPSGSHACHSVPLFHTRELSSAG